MNRLQNNCACTSGRGNLVYLTKVFFDGQENASPIMSSLTTTTTGFTQQLSIGGSVGSCESCCSLEPCHGSGCSNTCQNVSCGCDPCCLCNICCCGCGSDCSNISVTTATVFEVTNAYVITHSFNLTNPTLPADMAVTVDGNAITGIEESNGQYIGDISGIMPEITKCACSAPCSGMCPGNFVMVSAVGPWSLAATIVLEGAVYESGSACQFRLCYTTADGTPISVAGNSAFALCGVEIPCQVNGVAPSMQMDFDACVSILNPVLTAGTNGIVTLTGSLVVTPQLRLRITRPSLFNLDAKEIALPCDDLGQCSYCDPAQSRCVSDEALCCCGRSTPNRVGDILNMISGDRSCGGSSCGEPCGCSCGCSDGGGSCNSCNTCGSASDGPKCSAPAGITCQCCETNGYSF